MKIKTSGWLQNYLSCGKGPEKEANTEFYLRGLIMKKYVFP